jgi:hypothetical protein
MKKITTLTITVSTILFPFISSGQTNSSLKQSAKNQNEINIQKSIEQVKDTPESVSRKKSTAEQSQPNRHVIGNTNATEKVIVTQPVPADRVFTDKAAFDQYMKANPNPRRVTPE